MIGGGHRLADELENSSALVGGILLAGKGHLEPLPLRDARARIEVAHLADTQEVADLASGQAVICQSTSNGIKVGLLEQHGSYLPRMA